jgi:predicted O-methyltransferase YrrM
MFRESKLRRRYALELERIEAEMRQGNYTTNWTGKYLHYWMEMFVQHNLRSRSLDVLEIGSWEGMTSAFILRQLPLAHLTCVDTWEGAAEHKNLPQLSQVEIRFDNNTATFRNRLNKYKGNSLAFYSNGPVTPRFDLIYVDGSHRAGDVLADAILCFEMLRVGGILVFDDYLWRRYQNPRENPAGAINALLKMKRGSYELLMVHWQLVLRKTRPEVYQATS